MNPVNYLIALLVGLWFGYRIGKEATWAEVQEVLGPSWADVQREVAEMQ